MPPDTYSTIKLPGLTPGPLAPPRLPQPWESPLAVPLDFRLALDDTPEIRAFFAAITPALPARASGRQREARRVG